VLQQEHSPAEKCIEAGAVRILPKQFFCRNGAREANEVAVSRKQTESS
jgi:hypothetical protein